MGKGYFDTSVLDRLIDQEYKKRERERKMMLERSLALIRNYFKDKSVRTVLLIGSIIKEGRFYPFSDVDIAIEGLKGGYLKVMCELERILERDIDLVELERCRFRDAIEREGIKVI